MATQKKATSSNHTVVATAKRTSIGGGLRKRGSWTLKRKKPSRGQGKR
jgi:hypothetical protein